MNVQQARWSGKHLPDSHPVVRQPSVLDQVRGSTAGRLPAQQATFAASLSQRIEHVAIDLARTPDVPLTVSQRRMWHDIGREALRRSAYLEVPS